MKKALLSLVFVLNIFTGVIAQSDLLMVDTTGYYAFHINYWFNMHHFLWLEAFMQAKADSTLITRELEPTERAQLQKALDYYKAYLVEEDPRLSDYMTAFKVWITSGDLDTQVAVPDDFTTHMKVLNGFDKVYKTQFWPQHKKAAQEVLQNNLPIIRSTEKEYVDRITKLTRQFWQDDRVRVDITYYAKATAFNLRNRPYTSIFPTHVVMNASGENEVKGNWIELLYHESAHHLILGSSYFVGGTIQDLAEVEGLQPPRQLWHAFLFYFTGQVTKALLEAQGVDYPATYMERNKVFSRYYPFLQKHLTPYMERSITLTEATRNFIADLDKE